MTITGWPSQQIWREYGSQCRDHRQSTDAGGIDEIETSACYRVSKEVTDCHLEVETI
jgi:hypothetical protein